MANYLGIDISHDSVRIAQVRTGYRRLTLESFQEFPITGAQTLPDVLRSSVRPLCTKSNDVSISFPGDASFIRRVDLPATAAKQLAQLLPFELEAQLPFDIDEVIYAYKSLSASPVDGQLQMLTVSAPVQKVTSLLDIARTSLDHEPERIEPSTFALANLAQYVEQLATPTPIGLLHVDTTTTDFLILENGQVRAGRTVRSGTAGLPATGAKLARELRQTLLSWRATGGAQLENLFVTGPGANLQGVMEFFSGHLGVPASLCPLPALEGNTVSQELVHQFSMSVALALGLGTRAKSFNLRTGPIAYERGYGFLKEKVPLAAGIAAVLALSFVFSTWMQARALNSETAALRTSLGNVTLDVLGKRIEDPDEAQDKLTVSRSKLADPMPKLDAFDVMVAISDAVPTKTTHDIDEFDYQKGHVTIHGVVPSIPDAQEIANNLKKHACFKNVKIVRTNKVVNQDRQKYVLEFEVMCSKKKKKKKKSSTHKEQP